MIVFCDEVGYASIASSCLVCAIAVKPGHPKINGVKDSKQLSKQKREELYDVITSQLEYSFCGASPKKIEQLNIHYARYEAMRIAVEKLARRGIEIEKVIVDGKFPIPNLKFPQEAVIKADDKFWECSSASILAKVKRDRMMAELAKIEKYSHYDWENNAGYYTPKQRNGIVEFGPTDLHRVNFGYFQYCLYCHEKYNEFLGQGKTLEEYREYEKEEEVKQGKSFYTIWKERPSLWAEIKYGEKK